MFLGVELLLRAVHEKRLIEGLSEQELINPEGCGFNLRLGEIYRIYGDGYLGLAERTATPIEQVAVYSSHQTKSLVIQPGDFFLAKTVETVNVPSDLVGIIKPRSVFQRMGLYVRASQVFPGHTGQLSFALKNEGPATVKVDLGINVITIMFSEVRGKTTITRRPWQKKTNMHL